MMLGVVGIHRPWYMPRLLEAIAPIGENEAPMADVFSADKRRLIMQAVRRKGTAPELLLAQVLSSLAVTFTCNENDLPGKPDVVIPASGVAIFVHGCFWHGHASCNKGRQLSKTRAAYWKERIARNKRRDARVARRLRSLGYSVYIVWECELRRGRLPMRMVKRLSSPRRP